MSAEQEAYYDLSYYTLAHRDSSFIHQHVVDAFTAQYANEQTRPIGLTFSLVGLYLCVEHRFSGRQVQRVHTNLARHKQRPWPTFVLPNDRGSITVFDVLAAPEGPQRDVAIHDWCASVWRAFRDNRPLVAELLHRYGVVY
jgi:hypothetical protein